MVVRTFVADSEAHAIGFMACLKFVDVEGLWISAYYPQGDGRFVVEVSDFTDYDEQDSVELVSELFAQLHVSLGTKKASTVSDIRPAAVSKGVAAASKPVVAPAPPPRPRLLQKIA